jgi:hypothetical protein
MFTVLLIVAGILLSFGVLSGVIGLFADYDNAIPINLAIIVIFGLPALGSFWWARRRGLPSS